MHLQALSHGKGSLKLRFLAFSHAGFVSGFGVAAHQLYSRWAAAGHEIHVLAAHVREEDLRKDANYLPYRLHPVVIKAHTDVFGLGLLGDLITEVKPHALFFLYDLPVTALFTNQIASDKNLRPWLQHTVLYAPLDYVNLPPHWLDPIHLARHTLLQSRWGAETIRRESGLETDWIWLGVDRAVFRSAAPEHPLSAGQMSIATKEQAKASFNLSGKFLVISVSDNHGRKNLADAIKVFAAFARGKEDALLYLHTNPVDNGFDLLAVVSRLGIRPQVMFPSDLGLSGAHELDTSRLAVLYNAADVYLSTSSGEGFGLTLAEALACGLPVVAQSFSAIPEVVGEGGILTPPERLRTCPNGADLCLPKLEPMVDALEHLYRSPELRLELSQKCVRQARNFDWDKCAAKLLSRLEKAADFSPLCAENTGRTI